FEAQFASSPVLLITGQVDTKWLGRGKGVLHEAERQLEMLASVTKRAVRVSTTDEIPDVIVASAAAALSGRPGPVAVEIPIDLQYAAASVDRGAIAIDAPVTERESGDEHTLAAAAE